MRVHLAAHHLSGAHTLVLDTSCKCLCDRLCLFGSTSLFDAKPSHYGLGNLPLAFAPVYSRLFVSFVLTRIHICLKWLLVGRLRPTDVPHRWPVLETFDGGAAAQLEPALECFRGTAILNYILRALGARVHRSATIESTQIFDWDLVRARASHRASGEGEHLSSPPPSVGHSV